MERAPDIDPDLDDYSATSLKVPAIAVLVVIAVIALLVVVLGPPKQQSCVYTDLGKGAYTADCHATRPHQTPTNRTIRGQ